MFGFLFHKSILVIIGCLLTAAMLYYCWRQQSNLNARMDEMDAQHRAIKPDVLRSALLEDPTISANLRATEEMHASVQQMLQQMQVMQNGVSTMVGDVQSRVQNMERAFQSAPKQASDEVDLDGLTTEQLDELEEQLRQSEREV
jgi:predicted XRE-type DNA-binding protein